MIQKATVVKAAVIAAAAVGLERWWQTRRSQRLGSSMQSRPEPLQTWEGEGGAVPAGVGGHTVAERVGTDDEPTSAVGPNATH